MGICKAGLFFLLGGILLQACSPGGIKTPAPEALKAVTSTPVSLTEDFILPESLLPGLSIDQVRNADYQLGLLDQVRIVRMTDGRYEEGSSGADYIAVTMTNHIAVGDLDNDGENEAAALVAEQYGGVGTFYFLAVFESYNESPVFTTSAFIDKSPIVNNLQIQDGEIRAEVTIHTKDDPACCPSQPTLRKYRLNNPPKLDLVSYATKTPTGALRSIAIEAPVEGALVSGVVRVKGKITVGTLENTQYYRIIDMGGVELSAGPVKINIMDGGEGAFEEAIDLGKILTNTTVRIAVLEVNPTDGSLLAMDSVVLQVR